MKITIEILDSEEIFEDYPSLSRNILASALADFSLNMKDCHDDALQGGVSGLDHSHLTNCKIYEKIADSLYDAVMKTFEVTK